MIQISVPFNDENDFKVNNLVGAFDAFDVKRY